LVIHALPDTLSYANDIDDLRFPIEKNTLEYGIIHAEFNTTMFGNYTKINRIERIQNERWHKQYLVHRDDFKKRLNMNTEKFLYHGCSSVAADSIIKEYFNRSFAGRIGTYNFLLVKTVSVRAVSNFRSESIIIQNFC
jgi:hypothetical protein